MKKSRFPDSEVVAILKQVENSLPVPELYREHNISSDSFYKWRAKFDGMDVSMTKRMKKFEGASLRLKKMYAEERLKSELRKEAREGKWQSHLSPERWRAKPVLLLVVAFTKHAKSSVSVSPDTVTGLSSALKIPRSRLYWCT